MSRVKSVWCFPLCWILKYGCQQRDDLCALEMKVLLVEKIQFLPKRFLSNVLEPWLETQTWCVLEGNAVVGEGFKFSNWMFISVTKVFFSS